ncbi:MAG: DUF397 domain-containing protein [Actinophytocola sp.]|uniref:DUF397 domain-containing protein n=1 Tax=Actinophytocola sp. TaxID=1872138 RepID=UPI003C73FE38
MTETSGATVRWRKSSRSGGTNGNCVELTLGAVRDSKNPGGPHLEVSWQSLIAAVRDDHLSR